MIAARFSIQGLDRLRAKLVPNVLTGRAATAMVKRQAEVYKNRAVVEAPRGGPYLNGREGGTLKRSHKVRLLNQYSAEVVADAPYAGFVHGGTRPHWMPPGILPFGAMRTIALRGTKANPWMERAFRSGESAVKGNLDQMASDVANEWGGG